MTDSKPKVNFNIDTMNLDEIKNIVKMLLRDSNRQDERLDKLETSAKYDHLNLCDACRRIEKIEDYLTGKNK